MNTSYILATDHITIAFENGEQYTVYSSNPTQYSSVANAIKTKNWTLAYDLCNPVVELERTFEDCGASGVGVHISNGVVYFNDTPIHNTLTERMLSMLHDGFDVLPLKNFLANLMENISFRAVKELYGFLEASNLPITEDGHFLAYKRINRFWKDIYTGKMDNSIGSIVSMERNMVDEDKDQTCSVGLHFCAREYLEHFGTSVDNITVMVKINPRDVVAIPSDYNNTKGRCCRYEVIRELDDSVHLERAFHPSNEQEEDELEPQSDVDIQELEEWEASSHNLTPDDFEFHGCDSVVRFVSGIPVELLDSPSAAEAKYSSRGVYASNVRRVCEGKRMTCGGFEWAWFNNTDHTQLNILLNKGTITRIS